MADGDVVMNPVKQEMDRDGGGEEEDAVDAITAPPEIVANLIVAGAIMTRGGVGMFFNPLGMFSMETIKKMVKAKVCGSPFEASMSYVAGDYSEGYAIEQAPKPCCAKQGYYKAVKKDYQSVLPDSKQNIVQKKAIEKLREKNASDKSIAKAFPDNVVVGVTEKVDEKKSFSAAPWGFRVYATQDGTTKKDKDVYFEHRSRRAKNGCCAPKPTEVLFKNGPKQGYICVNIKTPIFNQDNVKVAELVQLAPVLPIFEKPTVTCIVCQKCQAQVFPTVQSSIVRIPEYTEEFSMDELTRLTTFLFTINDETEQVGGGQHVLVKKLLMDSLWPLGWPFGFTFSNSEYEFVGMRQAMNGGLLDFGDLLDRIRGTATAGAKYAKEKVSQAAAAASAKVNQAAAYAKGE